MSVFRWRPVVLALATYALGLVPFYFLTPVHQGVQDVLQALAKPATITPTSGPDTTAGQATVLATVVTGPPHVQPGLVPPSDATPNSRAAIVPTVTPDSSIGTALPASPVASSTAAASPAAWFLYSAKGDLWETNGDQTIQLTHNGHLSQPALDGDVLVYVEREKNYSDLWLAQRNAAPRRITHNASADVASNHWVSQPTLLPGGGSVDVLSDQNKDATGVGDLAIWHLDLPAGSSSQLSHPPAYTGGDQDIAVNPRDSATIVFTRYTYAPDGHLLEGLMWLSADSQQTVPLTATGNPSRQASFSPDGGSLAFVQTNGHADDLYVARIDATPQPRLVGVQQAATGTIAMPVWNLDATELAYVALNNRQFQIWTCPVGRAADGTFVFGSPRQITTGEGIDAASRPVWLTSATAADLSTWLSAVR